MPEAVAGPWPRGASFDEQGLSLAGVPATTLANGFGTPLLIVDEQEVRDRCRRVRASFPRALYAVKAFTAHAVIRLALEEGLDLLAATGGEVEACLRAGAAPSRVALHGNAKTDAELELAVGEGLGLVVADGLDEIRRLDEVARTHGRPQRMLLRVVPEVDVETHEAIATGHDASKFGTPLASAAEVLRSAAGLPGLIVDGLHAHIGSQVLRIDPYLRTIDALVELCARVLADGIVVRTIDVGGGFGVRYIEEEAFDLEAAARAFRLRLADASARLGIEAPDLVVEPGRWLVANAGVTLYRVVAGKSVSGNRRLLAVDGGMSDNVRPALYDAAYTVAVASGSAASAPPGPAGDAETTFTVVGRHCESGDTLAEDVCLPASTGPGDLLAFAATGAYTYSLASTYNRVGRPAVVAVRDRIATPWLRREDVADLDRLEVSAARNERAVEPVEGISIRPARPRDARSYDRFWAAIVEEGRSVRTERVTSSVRDHRRRFRRPWTEREAQIVAVDDSDRVVGHVYVQRESHPVTRHVATLGIAVAADHRGRGIGAALLAEAVRWARAVGVEKIVLSVYPHNIAAIALYRRFGFIEEGRLARHSRKSYGDEDEILMAAWIGGSRDDAADTGAEDVG